MSEASQFATLFRLALLALGLSKARAASLLQIDKSLVGRWASGAVRPTEHNLTRVTELVAQRIDGFGLQDWQRDPDSFAQFVGLDPGLARMTDGSSKDSGVMLNCLAEARKETERRGTGLEGFWRTTRPSVVMPDRMFHDYGMIRIGEGGLPEVTMGGAGLSFNGWALPLEGNVFMMLDSAVGFTPVFLIFRGVGLPRVERLDGLVLLATLDATRSPAALPILLERIGDLTGDRAADDARCRELGENDPFDGEDKIDPATRAYLLRDVGPEAAQSGKDMFLMVSAANSRSVGSTGTGVLKG